MSKYIKPPDSSEVSWRFGPPPEVGWWPATWAGTTELIRFWNVDEWSDLAYHYSFTKDSIPPIEEMEFINSPYMMWTDRWWLK